MSNNPSRGCGKKKKDSFYIEATGSADGTLNKWTWLLDDAYIENEALLWQVPARQALLFKPRDSIIAASLIKNDDFYHPRSGEERLLYEVLRLALPNVGVVDHVGKNRYSAYSFAKEVQEYGPSRRISKNTAVTISNAIQEFGAVPLVFTHDRMPLFYNTETAMEALAVVRPCIEFDDDAIDMRPTYMQEGWGAYAIRDQHSGYNSFMIPILSAVHAVEMEWSKHKNSDEYQVVKDYFANLDYSERPFGLSWGTQITYTIDKGSKLNRDDLAGIHNLRILDLDKDEVVEVI